MSEQVFRGVYALLTLVRTLYRRPRYFERDDELGVRGDLPLPLVCLLRETGANGFLSRLDLALDVELAEVPHVRVDAADPGQESDAVLPLLDALHRELREGQFGKQGSIKRFDNYELARHLTGHELPRPQSRRDEPIKKVLRAWGLGSRFPAEAGEAADRAGDRVQSIFGLLKFTGYLIGLYWGRDRVLGLFRERRWFMRQPYMVPRHSLGFLRFTERLTRNRRSAENPDQVHKLLVHAFLEDLRIAYRRNRLRFLPRRPGWRRTAYVTVLVDNVHQHGGWELLRLINEVRNETGELDPLLIIATADGPPPGLPSEPRPSNEPTVAEEALVAWKDRLPRRRQLLAADARYLFVTLPNTNHGQSKLSERDSCVWRTVSGSRPRAAPRLARRGAGELIAVVALLGALTLPLLNVADHWTSGCAFVHAWSTGISTAVVNVDGHDQCVGYSDSVDQLFGDNERLRHAQQAVFAQNEIAKQLHEDVPGRPYVGLIYFAGLTSNNSAPATEHAVAEELEGVVIRQREQNTTKSTVEPLLRIIVANGGTGMVAAPEVVRNELVPLAETDSSILGVVGLDRSVAQTEDAITELGRHGIPVLGSTLTSVGLGSLSPLYFQLVPDNSKQAELVSDYARKVRTTKVTVYHPPVNGANSYVNTLVNVMAKQLSGDGVKVASVGWQLSPNDLATFCPDSTDRRNEIAFYAGREVDFGDFLLKVRRNCAEPEKLPRIVADDAVSRFVAHAPYRKDNELNGVTISYVGMGGLVALAGQECVEGKPGAIRGAGSALDAFCAGYRQLRQDMATLSPEAQPIASWPGERVGGLYDAAGIFVDAARRMQPRTGSAAPYRGAVAMMFREMTFQGATGMISFGESRIANKRNLAILTIDNVRDLDGPSGTPRCSLMLGTLYSEQQPRQLNGCPIASANS